MQFKLKETFRAILFKSKTNHVSSKRTKQFGWSLLWCDNEPQLIPIRGTASDVVGIDSATKFKNTVNDSRIVTPEIFHPVKLSIEFRKWFNDFVMAIDINVILYPWKCIKKVNQSYFMFGWLESHRSRYIKFKHSNVGERLPVASMMKEFVWSIGEFRLKDLWNPE